MGRYTFTKANRYPYLSPLRYPGGKAILYPLLKDLIALNCSEQAVYCEPYAGGAGAALELLINNDVQEVRLNDRDFHVYAFWHVLLHDTNWLIDRIQNAEVSLHEWHHQRMIYDNFRNHTRREVAFSTFFLNRCNRGGILPKAGPIGGLDQLGRYKIDARFNKANLIERIMRVAELRGRIHFTQLDAFPFMKSCFRDLRNARLFMYIDPPYYVQGEGLYLNHYQHEDHVTIASLLRQRRHRNWVLSYDNTQAIMNLYRDVNMLYFDLQYSLQNVSVAKEIMAFSDSIVMPSPVQRLLMN